MYNSMIFPATVDEFMEEYKVVDSEHVYSNGTEMVPIFRMKQWFEHEANHNAELGKMEIVRCKDCKHWNLQVGNVKGDGLGSCDFHNVNLVTGEGFCYWADMRIEETDCDYERAVEQLEHDMLYEPTFNKDDGSM